MKKHRSAIEEIVQDCMAARVRMVGRAVSSIYDRAVAPLGLTIAQLNLLAADGTIGPCSPSKLGSLLQLDRSTVSRNLDRLVDAGWMRATTSDAKGIREIALTPSGIRKVESTLPQWRVAQEEAAQMLGTPASDAIRQVADAMFTSA